MNLNSLKTLGIALGFFITFYTYAPDKPVLNSPAPFTYADTRQEFDKLLKENKLVVVQFFNPTCPVCMAFKRKGIFGKAAKALPHIKFGMTSSDQGANLHHEYKIESFPTFVFFKNGKEIGRYKGYVESKIFINKINDIFSAAALQEPENVEAHVEKG